MTPDQHPEWESLLSAVTAAPDDDLPRLVAADWLDEHGQPERAEFIRLQIEREKDDRPELAWREQALLNHPLFGPLWAAEACPHLVRLGFAAETGSALRDVSVSGAERVTFRRGFPFRVTCPAAEWLAHGHLVVPRQPVREVYLSKCDDVPFDRWWEAFDALKPLATLALDSRSVTLPGMLQEQLPDTQVLSNGAPAPTLVLAGHPVPNSTHAPPLGQTYRGVDRPDHPGQATTA